MFFLRLSYQNSQLYNANSSVSLQGPSVSAVNNCSVVRATSSGCTAGAVNVSANRNNITRKRERCDTTYKSTIVCMQVRSNLFGKSLEKVSVYGADEYPGVSPVCVLFSGAHYDTLVQMPVAA